MSVTPVLCDQLEAPGVMPRFARFVNETRHQTHEEDAAGLRAGGHDVLAAELERAWGDYARAAERMEQIDGDLLAALGAHARWTSSATHAVLPLLATDAALREQVRSGVRSHLRRFGGDWQGGFWLPECGHDPAIEPALLEAGVRSVCIEMTSRLGLGAPGHLRPVLSESGLVLAPVDRQTMSLVWSDDGYPSSGAYRDYHHHTVHHHNPWANSGDAYDHAAALALAREHARDFVARTQSRLREQGAGIPGGGLVVCALDTELLGHWWYEGVAWLEAVVEECSRHGLELLMLDEALAETEPAPLPGQAEWGPSSWGAGGDLSTWSGPAVAELAFAARAGELDVLRAVPAPGGDAIRAMLALQASDWAFMVTRGVAMPYAHERHDGHRELLTRALAGEAVRGELRNLAIDADPIDFVAPR
jgi:1,4-alpha-glucan branching enzyme